MPRTDEQKAADEQLTAAIERASLAYFGNDGEVLMEYVVVLAQTSWRDGESDHSFSTLFRDSDVSTSRALGLLECAASTLRNPVRVVRDE